MNGRKATEIGKTGGYFGSAWGSVVMAGYQRRSVDLIPVARLLGDRDLRVLQRYAHPGAEEIRRTVQALEARERRED